MSTLKNSKEIKREQREQKRQQAKRQKAEKKAIKQAQQAQRKTQRKDQDGLYVMRKNTALKIGRCAIWLLLSCIFLRGAITSLRPDPTAEVNRTIQDFKSELTQLKEADGEILAFAQNFAVKYFSYSSEGEAEYLDGLKQFASTTVTTGSGFKIPYGMSCRVLYANAYRKTQQSENQFDVWVSLLLEYTSKTQNEEGGYTTQTTEEETILKIPVLAIEGQYIVEDVPVFVNDSTTLKSYASQPFRGTECDSNTRDAIRLSLTNFFTSYYRDKQSVINYYLSPSADAENFVGLNGRVAFEKIHSMTACYKSEGISNQFVVLASVGVRDKNGMSFLQNYHLEMEYRDKQYYIQSMNTKTHNF